MELLLAPESLPFSVALVLLLGIAVIEGVGLLMGLSLSGWVDQLLPEGDADLPGSWLGWLHVGKVPMLVLMALFLTAFSFVGFACESVVHRVSGFYPALWISVPVAFFGALPLVRISASVCARLLPGDETSAVPLSSLVGGIAVVINGTARLGYPAQARTSNHAGQTFYVHVEPDSEGSEFVTGDAVLLVRQISGSRFQAIINPRPDLL